VRLVVRVVVRSPTIAGLVVRLVVAISDLSYDQSWRPATARTDREVVRQVAPPIAMWEDK
jgi:hypothetical protein